MKKGHVTRQQAATMLGLSVGRVTQLFDAGLLAGYREGEGRRCQLFITTESINQRLANPGKPGNPRTVRRD